MPTGPNRIIFHRLALIVAAWMPLAAVGCRTGKGVDRWNPVMDAHAETANYRLFDEWSSHQPMVPAAATNVPLPSLPTDDIALVSLTTENRRGPEVRAVRVLNPIPQPPEPPAVPIPDPGRWNDLPELSFHQAIAACLENDPVLRAGFEEILMADADQVTAALKPNPELDVLQSLLPLTRPFVADEREGGPPQLDVEISYPIDWYLFGKRAAEMRSAQAEWRVSQAEYADLVRQRVLEASLAYYDVMEAQALVDLAEQDSENLLMVEQITRIAVDNGAMPRVELNRIRLDRLNSQQALREAQRDLRIAKAELRALMGGYVPVVASAADDFRVTDQLTEAIQQGLQLEQLDDIEQLVAIAEGQRPDIQALRLEILQSQAEIEVQCREAYPEVTPVLGYTRQFQRRAIGFPDANSWAVGVALTLPVYNRNQGNRLRADAQWRQSVLQLQAGLVELQAEVASVAAELDTAAANAAAVAEDQLQLAEEVRDSIRQAYEAGGRPLIDVLDSQRNYRETYENYINSRADYLRAAERFRAALGGDMRP